MAIMELSSQTSVLIHMLVISYLQSCLLLVQKQGHNQKNVPPPLTSWVGKGSKDERMELSGDKKAGSRQQENSRVCKCCHMYDLSVNWLSCFMLKQISVLGKKILKWEKPFGPYLDSSGSLDLSTVSIILLLWTAWVEDPEGLNSSLIGIFWSDW